jgi:hypothetical protein
VAPQLNGFALLRWSLSGVGLGHELGTQALIMQRSLKLSSLPQRMDRPATSVAGPVVLRFKRSCEHLLMKSAIQAGTRAALVLSWVCQTLSSYSRSGLRLRVASG